jgi:hypothetical protein
MKLEIEAERALPRNYKTTSEFSEPYDNHHRSGCTKGKVPRDGIACEQYAAIPLKLSFEDNTPGTNLQLCAGTMAQFTSGVVGIQLSDSGGPGFVFLIVIDAAKLNGLVIYVLHAAGTVNANFTLTVD